MPEPITRVLTPEDHATLAHLIRRGIGENTLRAAIRASTRSKRKKSKRVVDVSLITELLDYLDQQIYSVESDHVEFVAQLLLAYRDQALLAVMFASSGCRRSEISDLMWGQVHYLEPNATDALDFPDGIPSMGLNLGRTKTTDAGEIAIVFLSGRAAILLVEWNSADERPFGPVFLRIPWWGHVFDTCILPHSVNAVLKNLLSEIELDPADFSAHGVRAGYITSALKAGIPAPEVMERTLHKSLETLMSYFSDEHQRRGRAAHLV